MTERLRARNSVVRLVVGALIAAGLAAALGTIALAVVGGPILFGHAKVAGAQKAESSDVQQHKPH